MRSQSGNLRCLRLQQMAMHEIVPTVQPQSPASFGPPAVCAQGWTPRLDEKSRKYFYQHKATGLCQWNPPTQDTDQNVTARKNDLRRPIGSWVCIMITYLILGIWWLMFFSAVTTMIRDAQCHYGLNVPCGSCRPGKDCPACKTQDCSGGRWYPNCDEPYGSIKGCQCRGAGAWKGLFGMGSNGVGMDCRKGQCWADCTDGGRSVHFYLGVGPPKCPAQDTRPTAVDRNGWPVPNWQCIDEAIAKKPYEDWAWGIMGVAASFLMHTPIMLCLIIMSCLETEEKRQKYLESMLNEKADTEDSRAVILVSGKPTRAQQITSATLGMLHMLIDQTVRAFDRAQGVFKLRPFVSHFLDLYGFYESRIIISTIRIRGRRVFLNAGFADAYFFRCKMELMQMIPFYTWCAGNSDQLTHEWLDKRIQWIGPPPLAEGFADRFQIFKRKKENMCQRVYNRGFAVFGVLPGMRAVYLHWHYKRTVPQYIVGGAAASLDDSFCREGISKQLSFAGSEKAKIYVDNHILLTPDPEAQVLAFPAAEAGVPASNAAVIAEAAPPVATQRAFCPDCGTRDTGGKFCSGCGRKTN